MTGIQQRQCVVEAVETPGVAASLDLRLGSGDVPFAGFVIRVYADAAGLVVAVAAVGVFVGQADDGESADLAGLDQETTVADHRYRMDLANQTECRNPRTLIDDTSRKVHLVY